jgi:hypothetical protein
MGSVLPVCVEVVVAELFDAKAGLGAGEGPTGLPTHLDQTAALHVEFLKSLLRLICTSSQSRLTYAGIKRSKAPQP